MAAKRSPILGYNHNVRYRGLVFHVQTEDSGVLSPHLFTHLFHGGVIVSTRKLVYDADASEDVVKNLMQAQHKAVLKDLKLHTFDDKIDEYLGTAPGLEPRAMPRASGAMAPITVEPEPAAPEPAAPEPAAVPQPAASRQESDKVAVGFAPTRALDEEAQRAVTQGDHIDGATVRERVVLPEAAPQARTQTGDRTRQFRSMPPPETAVPDEVLAGATIPTPQPRQARTVTPPSPPPMATRTKIPITPNIDSSPDIEIIGGDLPTRTRTTRDTDINDVFSVPAAVSDDLTRPSDGVPSRADTSSPVTRPASQSAATLPPVTRPPSRPSITPPSPQVIARPLPPEQRKSETTDAIEIYAPAAPEPTERGGQYSIRRDPSAPRSGQVGGPPPVGTQRMPRVAQTPAIGSQGVRPPAPPGPPKKDPPSQPRLTAPMASVRPGGAPPPTPPTGQNNVVMTRPAVIVGAPPKAAGPQTAPRIRKAREDEGRGFGQGLISEKSLDEVILAYLSEDGDEK